MEQQSGTNRAGKRGDPPVDNGSRGAGAYVGLGLQFALSMLLFLYAGQWVDRKLGTRSLFTIIGVFVGAAAAFYSIYKKLMAAQREDEEKTARKR